MEKACGLHCTKINNIIVKIGKDVILKDVNIHIHCGELTVIIGRNGAGKTTLLKTIYFLCQTSHLYSKTPLLFHLVNFKLASKSIAIFTFPCTSLSCLYFFSE